jgi:hypothetical protein
MQLIVLSPDAPPHELRREQFRIDPSDSTGGLWWILDRLESAIAGAQGAADYALAASWSMSGDSRRRTRDLGLVLLASWITVVVLVGVIRLNGDVTTGGMDAVVFASGLLALATILVLAAVWSRRWN